MIARRASRSPAAAYFTTKRGVTSRWKPASARRSRPPLAEHVPAPPLEAAHDVLAARLARGLVRRRVAEALARPRELTRGVETNGLLGRQVSIVSSRRGEDDRPLAVGALVTPALAPADRQGRRDAQQRQREHHQSEVAGARHAGAQRAGSIRKRGWPYSTPWAFSTKIFITRPATF